MRGERRKDLENFIRQLRDVIAAKVELDEEEQVIAVRVLAKMGRSSRQIARDVQSALLGRFGVEVGAEAISVAQLTDELEEDISPVRFRLVGVGWRTHAGTAEVQVELAIHGASVTGSAAGLASLPARYRLAARATLDAIHALLGARLFEVVDAQVMWVGSHAVAVATLVRLEEPGASYVGCAPARGGDETEAVVKATLNALNRHVTWQDGT